MVKCSCSSGKRARWGRAGDQKATWCFKCPDKPATAVNVYSAKCPCTLKKRPTFGLPDHKRPTWCFNCPKKPATAVNIYSAKCPCTLKKRPTFGLPDHKRPTWCADCPEKPVTAVNILSAKCPCILKKQPTFGLPDHKRPTWCFNCPKKPAAAVDIYSAKCPCILKKQPNFGLPDDKRPTWCADCPEKPVTAVNILSAKCPCILKKKPNFGLPDDKRPTWCADCLEKPGSAINIVSPRCTTCKLTVPSRYAPWCAPCYFASHPEVPPPKAYRTRENHLFSRVRQDFPDRFRFDKPLDGGCSGKKPDMFADLLTHTLHGENDEHSHRGVDCENKRLMQLFVDAGNRPQVVVRFNPDKYTDSAGVKHASTFFMDDKHVLCVDEDRWEARYQAFKARLNHWLGTVPTKELTVEYLFYDSYDSYAVEPEGDVDGAMGALTLGSE